MGKNGQSMQTIVHAFSLNSNTYQGGFMMFKCSSSLAQVKLKVCIYLVKRKYNRDITGEILKITYIAGRNSM
jgi:hypothetical protein